MVDTAFPTPPQVSQLIDALRHEPKTSTELQRDVNARKSVLDKILTHLEVELIIEKRDRDYVLLKPNTQPDYSRWESVTKTRYTELRHMQDYVHEKGCLMHFIAAALDDPAPVERCGRCKNCTGAESKFKPDAAAIGQFISNDPKGLDAGDANVRRYVGNDPLNLTDPDGLEQKGAGAALQGLVVDQ